MIAALSAQQPPQQPPQSASPTPAQPPAQPGAPAGGGPGGGAPPPRAILPATASSVAGKPDAYYGQYVSVYATVEQSLSPTAFSIDQDKTKSTGMDVLVLAPRLHEPVVANTYVTVIGEVVKPDMAEITKKMKAGAGGLTPEILAQHPGRPVILATAVINTALIDLAKFIPPPLTPEEAAFDKVMKQVSAANGALRKGIDASNVELVKTNTGILTKMFAEAEAFWKGRGKMDAVKFAQTARTAAQAVETAAGMGNWNEAKTQNATLGQQCQSCHTIYRERGEDGSFFIKPPTGGQN
jgi:hypothetical protein